MKLNKCENTGVNVYELEIAIEPDKIREAASAVYKRDKKKYNVPGFRKGHAPRNLIEKMYGADIFTYDAVNDLFPAAYDEAVKEAGLEPVASPDAEMVSLSAEDGAVLKAVVTVKPEVKVGNYKGLKAEKPAETVDEARVDTEIAQMQERGARLLTREGAAQDGDIADIDYEGFVNDVPFEGGKGEAFKLTLGSGQFIPGFEEQVVGHASGEEFDVNVTFPTEYHSDELAGKEAVFKVKVNEVQYKELPELDDEFAKDVSEYDTLDELKASIREAQQKQLDEQADIEVENALMDQVVETVEGEIPEVMYENRMDDMVQDFAYRLQQQGLNLETYLQFSGMDMKGFRDGFKEQAEKQVKTRLAMEAIVKLENIEPTEEEVDAEIARMAEKYSMEAEQIRNIMPLDEVRKDLAANKAIDVVKQNATITEAKPKKKAPAKKKADGEEKPKAKKTTTKKAAPKKDAEEKAADKE